MTSRDQDLKIAQDASSSISHTLLPLDPHVPFLCNAEGTNLSLTACDLIADRATTSAQNCSTGPGDKLENDLELKKDSKVSKNSADDVTGRKGKGTGLGFLEKLVPGKHGKEAGE